MSETVFPRVTVHSWCTDEREMFYSHCFGLVWTILLRWDGAPELERYSRVGTVCLRMFSAIVDEGDDNGDGGAVDARDTGQGAHGIQIRAPWKSAPYNKFLCPFRTNRYCTSGFLIYCKHHFWTLLGINDFIHTLYLISMYMNL